MARKTYLTERDLELLLTLVERRSETLDLLHHRFFAGAKRKTALNRLRALERGGFVRREEVVTFESGGHFHGVYTLGAAAKAALTLRSLAQEHFDGRRFSARLRETSMPHQIATNRVGDWLGAILSAAALAESAGRGALLLAFYSAGLAIPFLLTALAFRKMTSAFAVLKRHYRAIMAAGGAVLIVMGVLIWTGELFQLNIEAQRFLDRFGLNFFNDV